MARLPETASERTSPITCPECGRRSDDRSPIRIASLFHWRRWIPPAVVFVAVIGLCFWLHLDRRPSGRIGSGMLSPQLVEPALKPADLRSIAAGERVRPGVPLSRSIDLALNDIIPGRPGRRVIEVGFVEPAGRRMAGRSRGWPLPWIWMTEHSFYDDAATRSGFIPARTNADRPPPENPYTMVTDPRNAPPRQRRLLHNGILYHQPPPEETGGVVTTRVVDLISIAAAVGLVVLLGLVTWPFAALGGRLFGRKWRRWSRIGHLVIVAVALLAVGILGWFNVDQYDRAPVHAPTKQMATPPQVVYWIREEWITLPWTLEEFRKRLNEPQFDRELAQIIVDGFDGSHPDDGRPRYLAAVAEPESIMWGTGAWYGETMTVLWVSWCDYTRRPDRGDPIALHPPAGLSVWMQFGDLVVQHASGNPRDPTLNLHLDLRYALTIVAGLVALLMIARGACRLIHAMIVRARRKRGRCAACGYILRRSARSAIP